MAVRATERQGPSVKGPSVRWGNDVKTTRGVPEKILSTIRFVTDILNTCNVHKQYFDDTHILRLQQGSF